MEVYQGRNIFENRYLPYEIHFQKFLFRFERPFFLAGGWAEP